MSEVNSPVPSQPLFVDLAMYLCAMGVIHERTSLKLANLDKQPHLLDKWSSMNPLGRLGRPDELRGVVNLTHQPSALEASECRYSVLLPTCMC